MTIPFTPQFRKCYQLIMPDNGNGVRFELAPGSARTLYIDATLGPDAVYFDFTPVNQAAYNALNTPGKESTLAIRPEEPTVPGGIAQAGSTRIPPGSIQTFTVPDEAAAVSFRCENTQSAILFISQGRGS